MLQNFSKGEDKAFFRQNDLLYDQIYFLREINEQMIFFDTTYVFFREI